MSKATIVRRPVVEVTDPGEVTLTMNFQQARELHFLLGSIGGYAPGGFRSTTEEPLYRALGDVGIDSPDENDKDAYDAMVMQFEGLWCDLFDRRAI